MAAVNVPGPRFRCRRRRPHACRPSTYPGTASASTPLRPWLHGRQSSPCCARCGSRHPRRRRRSQHRLLYPPRSYGRGGSAAAVPVRRCVSAAAAGFAACRCRRARRRRWARRRRLARRRRWARLRARMPGRPLRRGRNSLHPPAGHRQVHLAAAVLAATPLPRPFCHRGSPRPHPSLRSAVWKPGDVCMAFAASHALPNGARTTAVAHCRCDMFACM